VDDIMGLFGTTSAPGIQTPHPNAMPPSFPPTPASSFPPMGAGSSTPHAASPPQPAAAAPSQQRLTAYPAYDKNDLKITLTPQTSAAKPGVVMILARFQVSGGEPATGLSFQAAVPKVSKTVVSKIVVLISTSFFFFSVTTTPDAAHVQSKCKPWCC